VWLKCTHVTSCETADAIYSNICYTFLYFFWAGYLFVFIARTPYLVQAHGSNSVNCLSFTSQQPNHNSPAKLPESSINRNSLHLCRLDYLATHFLLSKKSYSLPCIHRIFILVSPHIGAGRRCSTCILVERHFLAWKYVAPGNEIIHSWLGSRTNEFSRFSLFVSLFSRLFSSAV
jgi:hypothetical protein